MELPLAEARRNDEIIAMGSSQVLRWIDELNGVTDADEKAGRIKAEIRALRREQSSAGTSRKMRELYAELDSVQFKPDYMCLIIEREKDYKRACKGFFINGVKYKRLLGTAGGIKNSTIVFVSDRLHDELARRIDNGRDLTKELVPAKFEAYKALACSASIPVSMPKGVIVVHDVETVFHADTIYLDDENDGEPTETLRPDTEITMDASDGYGLMLPSLAERWSAELQLDYVMSGCNTRFAFEKGMVFAFDFIEFADEVAKKSLVKDVWGNTVDIHDVELILTESMVKLWDSYDSCESYVNNCMNNGYTFGVPKVCPEKLENSRSTNYQFIQSYDLSDDDIDRLIKPTMDEISDVLTDDWRKSVLFLRGSGLNEKNVGKIDNNYLKAIMIDPRIAEDPYVRSAIYQLIKNRIDEAKIGVLKVHGNYSMLSGDPYALCQSVFELPVTGILKAGEIYNKYWIDTESDTLVCFRAPMSTHENIRKVTLNRSDEAAHWYQYMKTCTILNAWDTIAAALNGADTDGDLVMLTDNEVLVSKHKEMPAIMCVQRKAKKIIPTEEDIVKSNVASFGNEIGQITNRVTSMFEVKSRFKPEDKEYKELDYRIRCGQLYQQNSIDKAKGIVAKPMPRTWYDWHAISQIEDQDKRDFYRRIVADRKPAFMRYIYPDLMKQYNTYISNINKNALREFHMTVDELSQIPYKDLTDRQREFLMYCHKHMPVGTGRCVMNIICEKFEKAFDGFVGRSSKDSKFDYTIMKSGVGYTQYQYYKIKQLYEEYNKKLRNYVVFSLYERVDRDDSIATLTVLHSSFIRECESICPNSEQLCDIVLDLCYKQVRTKKFAWSMCGGQIIRNLLKKNNGIINFPVLSDDGDIEFAGEKYKMEHKEIDIDGYYSE